MKQLWLATTVFLITAPVRAQPINEVTNADEITVAKLEQEIGGRTRLKLDFQSLTLEEVGAAMENSSGLTFGAAAEPETGAPTFGFVASGLVAPTPNQRLFEAGLREHINHQIKASRWNGEVGENGFWLTLLQWNRAARVKRERASPAARFPDGPPLSAFFDAPAQKWRLFPSSELVTGRVFHSWPCLILATQFQRNQKLNIAADEPQNTPQPVAATTTEQKSADAARIVQDSSASANLFDTLSLNLSLYLEPKLLQRARLHLAVNEARDDAGEDLLPPATGARRSSSTFWRDTTGSNNSSRLTAAIALRPRQSTGHRLALLKVVITVRYPLRFQDHEITDFRGPQSFVVNKGDLITQAQLETPRVERGFLQFSAALELESTQGWRKLYDRSLS